MDCPEGSGHLTLIADPVAGIKCQQDPDSLRQYVSCRRPSIASEIHASPPPSVQATWTFIPVILCLPEYNSGCEAHDQHGSRLPSTMYCVRPSRSSAVGTYFSSTLPSSGVMLMGLASGVVLRQA